MNRERLLGYGTLVIALIAAISLGFQRFVMAMAADNRHDWDACFLPAAQAIVAGQSPYTVECYVYSPIYALLIAPLAQAATAKAIFTAALIIAGVASCFAVSWVAARGNSLVSMGLVAILAVVTLLFNYAIVFDLQLMGPELLILACLAFAVVADQRGQQVGAGLGVGLAAALKTWPAALVLWFFRSPFLSYLRAWQGIAVAGILVVVSALVVGGTRAVLDVAGSAVGASSQPAEHAYSVSGASRILFSENPIQEPIVVSPLLETVSLFVLTVWVLGLIFLVLRSPGDGGIALFNLAFCVNLLLPVSHYKYLLLSLPVLWLWSGRLLRNLKSLSSWIACVGLAVWFVVVLGFNPTYTPYLQIFAPTLLAATISIVLASMFTQEEDNLST